jgi:hypothetical protein
MVATDYLENRIDDETAKIKVDSYQKVASLGGWSGGGRTLWAIAAVGIVAGAMMGAVAPFFPMIALGGTALPSLTTIGTSIAAFAAAGLSFGFGGGLVLGRISGTAASVAQEQEERMKEWTVRQMLAQNPNAHIVPDEPQEKSPPKSSRQRASDWYHTYFNPRIGLTFAAIGAIGGLIMGAAFIATDGAIGSIMPALETLTGVAGIATKTGAILAYSAGVCASIGALWTFNMSKITSEVTGFFGRLMGGKIIGREWGPKKEMLKEPAQSYTGETQLPAAGVRKFESFQDLVAQQAANRENGEPLVTR